MKKLFLVSAMFGLVMSFVSCGDLNVSTTKDAAAAQAYYTTNVQPNINRYCTLCHDNHVPDYATAKSMIVPGKPDDSDLYKLATGKATHRKVWEEGSPKAETLKQWITMEQ